MLYDDNTPSISAELNPTAISAKSSASPLDGTEQVLVNDSGTLKKTTVQDIAGLGGGSRGRPASAPAGAAGRAVRGGGARSRVGGSALPARRRPALHASCLPPTVSPQLLLPPTAEAEQAPRRRCLWQTCQRCTKRDGGGRGGQPKAAGLSRIEQQNLPNIPKRRSLRAAPLARRAASAPRRSR